jgi:hypothetical protein
MKRFEFLTFFRMELLLHSELVISFLSLGAAFLMSF